MENEELIKKMADVAHNNIAVVSYDVLYIIIFLVLALFAAGFWLLKVTLEKKIEKDHQKDLIQFQNELDRHSEVLKHELSRSARNAECFIEKQHEIYSKLYSKLVISHGAALDMEQTGFAMANFSGFSEEEIKEIVDKLLIPQTFKAEILNSDTIELAFETYKRHLPLSLANEASSKVTDAMNNWVVNELYFSGKVNLLINKIVTSLRKYVNTNKLRLNPMYATLPRENSETLNDCQSILDNLKIEMAKEMQG